MAITLPLLKTMRRLEVRKITRIDANALLRELERMEGNAMNQHARAQEMEIAEDIDYYAGRKDGLIDAIQELLVMMMEAEKC